MLRTLLAAAIAAAGTAPAWSAGQEQRHHGAHEHGSAQLNLAWEGNVVTIELESPAVNIVGFEHAPRTDAQKQAVQSAVAKLQDADALFAFTPEARCSGRATDVESELDKGGQEEHAEFHAQYRFSCEKPDALKGVEVHVFKLFPKTRTLRAQVVSARGQSAAELKPGKARLTLR